MFEVVFCYNTALVGVCCVVYSCYNTALVGVLRSIDCLGLFIESTHRTKTIKVLIALPEQRSYGFQLLFTILHICKC